MTPPIMSMSTKTTEENNDAVVTSPVSRRTRIYKVVAITLVVTAVIVVGCVLGGIALHHRLLKKEDFTVGAKPGNLLLNQNIHVDYGKEIIFVSNLPEGWVDGLNALHDYSKGVIASLDTKTNRCYIDTISETFNEGLNKWRQFSTYNRVPVQRNMTALVQPIDKTVVRKVLGDNVAKHCEGVPTHWTITPSETPSGNIKITNDPDFNIKQNVQGQDRKKRAAMTAYYVCDIIKKITMM